MENYLEHTIRAGDTLQILANDLMDNVSRWQEIAFVNRLNYPYISDEVEYLGAEGVKRTGDKLVIPVTANERDLLPRSEIAELYKSSLGSDLDVIGADEAALQLTDDGIVGLRGDGNDLQTIVGENNLKQSLLLRLATPYGTLLGHPTYGSHLTDLIGTRGTSENLQRIRVEVERTVLTDSRVKEVVQVEARLDNEVVRLSLIIEPQDLDLLINLNLSVTEEGEIQWA